MIHIEQESNLKWWIYGFFLDGSDFDCDMRGYGVMREWEGDESNLGLIRAECADV